MIGPLVVKTRPVISLRSTARIRQNYILSDALQSNKIVRNGLQLHTLFRLNFFFTIANGQMDDLGDNDLFPSTRCDQQSTNLPIH